MPQPTGDIDYARYLVVHEGATLDDAARKAGCSRRTIERFSREEKWQEKKANALAYGQRVEQLKSALLDKAILTKDPQDVHAWQRVETAFPAHRYTKGVTAVTLLEVGGDCMELLVNYLAQHDMVALAALRPHLKGIATAWEARAHGRSA